MLALSISTTVLILKLIFIVLGIFLNLSYDDVKRNGSNIKRRNGGRRKRRKAGEFSSIGNILKSGDGHDYDEYDDRKAILVSKPVKEKGIDSGGIISNNNRKKKNLSINSSISSIKEEEIDNGDTNSVMSDNINNNDYYNKISSGFEKKKK